MKVTNYLMGGTSILGHTNERQTSDDDKIAAVAEKESVNEDDEDSENENDEDSENENDEDSENDGYSENDSNDSLESMRKRIAVEYNAIQIQDDEEEDVASYFEYVNDEEV